MKGAKQWRERKVPTAVTLRCVDCGDVIVSARALTRRGEWKHDSPETCRRQRAWAEDDDD